MAAPCAQEVRWRLEGRVVAAARGGIESVLSDELDDWEVEVVPSGAGSSGREVWDVRLRRDRTVGPVADELQRCQRALEGMTISVPAQHKTATEILYGKRVPGQKRERKAFIDGPLLEAAL